MLFFGKKDYFSPREDGTEPVIAFVGKYGTVKVFEVPAVVGRESGKADVLIDDATVSRKHFYIDTYGEKLTATDQGSTSGTVINGETLEPGIPYYLSEGDKIKIGKLSFVCHINKSRLGKKIKLPDIIHKDTAADTSEMSKADLKEAAAELNKSDAGEEAAAAAVVAAAAAEIKAEAAAEIKAEAAAAEEVKAEAAVAEAEVKAEAEPEAPVEEVQDDIENDMVIEGVPDEEPASEPVIKLMDDPILEEIPDVESEEQPDTHEAAADDLMSGKRQGTFEAETPDDLKLEEQLDSSEAEGLDDTIVNEHAHARRIRFVYYSGHTAVESFEITATPFVIGRAKTDYAPGAAGVSRRHCFVDRTGSTYFITDLESTNGVWINGRKIKPYNRTALENGDIVGIGDRVYKVEMK